jgi:hypothetical protein
MDAYELAVPTDSEDDADDLGSSHSRAPSRGAHSRRSSNHVMPPSSLDLEAAGGGVGVGSGIVRPRTPGSRPRTPRLPTTSMDVDRGAM